MSIDGVEGIHLLRTRQMGEDALIDAHIVVDPRITVSEGHAIGDSVRDELISRFDDIMDVLVHVDPEDDEVLFEQSKPLARKDVQVLLDGYLLDYELVIDDFRIHYLNGQIEVELILPFAFSEQGTVLNLLKKQCNLIKLKEKRITNIICFLKQNED
jgi:hypothetical protein